jgi:hypothetical protein
MDPWDFLEAWVLRPSLVVLVLALGMKIVGVEFGRLRMGIVMMVGRDRLENVSSKGLEQWVW